MTYSDAIIKRLNDLCAERNINLHELSVLSGVTYSTLRDLVKGYSKAPRIDTLHRIATGLGMTASEFLDFPEFNETPFENE